MSETSGSSGSPPHDDPETSEDERDPGIATDPAEPDHEAVPFTGTASDAGPTAPVLPADTIDVRFRVTGRARVVTSMDADFLDSLSASDVLVLVDEGAFMYADWHSLLTMVAGVASPGRPSHHLAQVARECGVPMVGHITGDITSITDGASIEVDAAAGTVRRMP